MNKLMQGIMVLLMVCLMTGCAGFGLWVDRTIGNNDGKYDGPTITITKTLSNGMPVTVSLDETGAVNVDLQLVDADGNVYEFVKDGKVTFVHDGVTYSVDMRNTVEAVNQ